MCVLGGGTGEGYLLNIFIHDFEDFLPLDENFQQNTSVADKK